MRHHSGPTIDREAREALQKSIGTAEQQLEFLTKGGRPDRSPLKKAAPETPKTQPAYSFEESARSLREANEQSREIYQELVRTQNIQGQLAFKAGLDYTDPAILRLTYAEMLERAKTQAGPPPTKPPIHQQGWAS